MPENVTTLLSSKANNISHIWLHISQKVFILMFQTNIIDRFEFDLRDEQNKLVRFHLSADPTLWVCDQISLNCTS